MPSRAALQIIKIVAIVVAFVGAGPACDRVEASLPDLLLITVDTLRPDHLGIYGYERPTSPRLDAIFADGAVFERAYSTEANTPPSVLSILSGLSPRHHGVRGFYKLLSDEVPLLPDRLPEPYQTAAFVSNVVLTDEAMGIADRFDHYDDFVDEVESDRANVYERNATRTTDAAIAWLAEARDPERPLLLWVHYIDPHGPYDAPDDAPRRFEHEGFFQVQPKRVPDYLRMPDVDDALTYVDRYDEEIAHTDHQVGRLLDDYAARAPLDEAFLVFTSDHGESMMEHAKWFTHGYHVWEEIIRVPLMIRGPGVQPGRRTGLVSGIDVVPTLLGAAGVEAEVDSRVGERWRGFDLRRAAKRPERLILAEASLAGRRLRAGIRGRDKWIFGQLPRRAGARFYIDLAEDPDELRRISWRENPPPAALTELIELDPVGEPVSEDRKGQKLSGPKIDPRVSETQRRQLEALGYGEASPAETTAP